MTVDEAKEIMKSVRAAFAAGGKSDNKSYETKDTDSSAAKLWDEDGLTLIAKGTPDVSKEHRRNNNAAVVTGLIYEMRLNAVECIRQATKDYTCLTYGSSVLVHKPVCGNCTEMACAASYKVSLEVPSKEYIGFVLTDGPGDHTFCVVGDVSGWAKVGSPPASSTAIVIDPWANVCCKVGDYVQQFEAKMKKWNMANKRIATNKGWAAPDATYLTKFKASGIEMRNARNSHPFTEI